MTTGSATSPGLDDRLARYAQDLRDRGAITTDAVHAAFATVPRHAFLRTFHYRADRHTLTSGEIPPDTLLDIIYANNALVTHDGRAPGQPMSSSSGPSVMARMLETLELRPGMRVLEIGGGTGYNAALIHAITGAEVTTLEAGHAAAAEAAATIAELDLDTHIKVVHADGYPGQAGEYPWDRIIVTCGIAGIPPAWLDQLATAGLIVAPIAHAGVHPILAVRHDHGRLVGTIALWADFMPAIGNLRPASLFRHDPETDLTLTPVQRLTAAATAVGADRYADLTCFLGTQDKHTTRAYLEHDTFDPDTGMTALVNDDAAAWIHHTGDLTLAGNAARAASLAARLRELAERWTALGEPAVTQWNTAMAPQPDLSAPLFTPTDWDTGNR